MAEPKLMTQTAPFPNKLQEIVENIKYRDGWRFFLENVDRDKIDGEVVGRGLTLVIQTLGINSYRPSDKYYRVNHYFIVPAATFDERSWLRWVFDRVVDVETHEAMEFFKLNNKRPYAPNHGPGRNPYVIHERGTEKDAKTMFTGAKTKGTV